MKFIFALRSYGDFVILINSLTACNEKDKFTIIASLHLKPLYDALKDSINLNGINIVFYDFKIKNGLFNLFSNKYLFSISTLVQLKLYNKAINDLIKSDSNELIVEKENRAWLLQLFTKIKLNYIVKYNANVYESFSRFFKVNMDNYNASSLTKNDHVVILPIARLKKRNFPANLVNELVDKIKKLDLNYSIFSFNKNIYPNDSIYDNFTSIIHIVKNSNFVICADSLQAHICFLFKKAHFIYIPKNGKTDFLTPFALSQNYYSTFDKLNHKFLDTYNVN